MSDATLRAFARKYIWWKTEPDAMKYPDRIIAQVMNLGEFNDVQTLIDVVGSRELLRVLRESEAGVFSPKSWTYWHYRLTDCAVDQVPPMPLRRVA